jgi:hypothetical protein
VLDLEQVVAEELERLEEAQLRGLLVLEEQGLLMITTALH